MPLRGIPNQLSPDLLKVLAEMGHGDEISKLTSIRISLLLTSI